MGLLFSRTGRRILMAVAGLVIAMLVGLGMMVSSIAAMASGPGGSWGSGCTYDAGKAGELIITNTATGDEVQLGAGQMQNAATILKIAQELGLPMRASQIALMVSLLPVAALADIIGYRHVYRTGLALFSLASLACAVRPILGGWTRFRRRGQLAGDREHPDRRNAGPLQAGPCTAWPG